MKTLIIDHYDSFTYNLVHLVAEINNELPVVLQHDECSYQELQQIPHDNIILSPGPGHAGCIDDFALGRDIIQHSTVPVLGICLGHQGIGCMLGGTVILSPEPMHGRSSRIIHNGDPLFAHIPESFNAIRYHSWELMEPLPLDLNIIARAIDGSIMAISHKKRALWGVQYHPESVATEHGKQLLINFNNLTPQSVRAKKPKIKVNPHPASQQQLYLITRKTSTCRTSQEIFEYLYTDHTPAVWLDSSLLKENKEHFSFMGCLDGPMSYHIKYDVSSNLITKQHGDDTHYYQIDIFTYLSNELKRYNVNAQKLPFNFLGGFVGYFGYELHALTALITPKYKSEHPDAQFVFLDRVVVFDHKKNECYLLALTPNPEDLQVQAWFDQVTSKITRGASNLIPLKSRPGIKYDYSLSQSHDCYLRRINQALQLIRNGESYEICLTNQMTFPGEVDPFGYYSILRKINPAQYGAFLAFEGLSIASSSIECYIRIDEFGHVESKPIKGTLARGADLQEDLCLKEKLKTHEKFQSENLMIVDLLRNDLGRVCQTGSVYVPHLMEIESYATVHQMVSTVRGTLRDDCTPIDCITATFPGGSMTGAPKKRTLQIIQELESSARGIYSGALGYISLNGAIDLSIVIRTAIITSDCIKVGVGGAIIALSEPQEEFEEMLLKAKSHQQTRAKMAQKPG